MGVCSHPSWWTTCLRNFVRLDITREMGDDNWQLDQLLDIFKRELEARERAGGSTVNKEQPSPPKPKRREDGTTHALLTGGDANCPTCTFFRGNTHQGIAKQYLMFKPVRSFWRSTGDVSFACEKITLGVTTQPSSSIITARADTMLVFALPTWVLCNQRNLKHQFPHQDHNSNA